MTKEDKEKIERVPNLKEKVDILTEKIEVLSSNIDKFAGILDSVVTQKTKNAIIDTSSSESAPSAQTDTPIPLEYRQLVDNVLNRTFDIEIQPKNDIPAFEFIIKVPKKYSNASDAHWAMYKSDSRPKVVTYAEGITGIRDWCEKVFNNFNQDTKSLIVMDRVQAQ